MKILPISIREPELGALANGAMTVLVRPVGQLAALGPGDLLWVREPFHLPARWQHLKPSVAALLADCHPAFVADHRRGVLDGKHDLFGPRRMAREMPKLWHRQHLRITAIAHCPLHDIAPADIAAAGWRSAAAFQARWDADGQLACAPLYTANPMVLRISFDRIAAQLPGLDAVAHAKLSSRRGPPSATPPPPAMPRVPAADRSPCPRCGIRRDHGCTHFPLPFAAAQGALTR